MKIFIDADACPVKDEVYRVAERYELHVTLVSNTWMRIPPKDWLELMVVDKGPDEADDWIADEAAADDIVISADIPLASRCLKKGAHVLGPRGEPFTEDNIGAALATRNLLSGLRDSGEMIGGPPPFQRRDRSQFLQSLDQMIQGVRRRRDQVGL
jgi:uncharacterized protein